MQKTISFVPGIRQLLFQKNQNQLTPKDYSIKINNSIKYIHSQEYDIHQLQKPYQKYILSWFQTEGIFIVCILTADTIQLLMYLKLNNKVPQHLSIKLNIVNTLLPSCMQIGTITKIEDEKQFALIAILIGSKTGKIAILEIDTLQKFNTYAIKLCQIEIIQIKFAKQNQSFQQQNIALVGCKNQTLFIINIYTKEKLVQITEGQPSLQPAISIQFNYQHSMILMTTTESITVYKLRKEIIQFINTSNSRNGHRSKYQISSYFSSFGVGIKGIRAAGFFGKLIWVVLKDWRFQLLHFDEKVDQKQTYLILLSLDLPNLQPSFFQFKCNQNNIYLLQNILVINRINEQLFITINNIDNIDIKQIKYRQDHKFYNYFISQDGTLYGGIMGYKLYVNSKYVQNKIDLRIKKSN